MNKSPEITLKKATMTDCENIHNMQIEAFEKTLEKYQDYATNPAAEPLETTVARMAQTFTDYYLIQRFNETIGAIRIAKDDPQTCRISPIFLLPDHQKQGYGKCVISAVEQLYPQATKWTLGTIKQETDLCRFYESVGYIKTGHETQIQAGMTIVDYEKTIRSNEEMKQPLKQYIDATNTHNFDEVEKYIHEFAEYVFSGTVVSGAVAIRDYFETTWSRIKDEKYWATEIQWIYETDTTMICLYRYNFNGFIDGKQVQGGGRATNVFTICPDTNQWKLLHEHLSK